MANGQEPMTEQQKLICSDEFDKALVQGADVRKEIEGTLKTRNKDNYELFYGIMLSSRRDIQEILDKKKKDRTPQEVEAVKAFNKLTKCQYKGVRDMIFLSEDEKTDENGVTNNIPKKLQRLADGVYYVLDLLRYIGDSRIDEVFAKRGITLATGLRLEDRSEVFQNENVKKDMQDIFAKSCFIQESVDTNERIIEDGIFSTAVPSQLQYDKQTNPSGLRSADFKKMVQLKYKMLKAESQDKEAVDKSTDSINTEAEKRTYDIARNETIRTGLMAMGVTEDEAEGEDGE